MLNNPHVPRGHGFVLLLAHAQMESLNRTAMQRQHGILKFTPKADQVHGSKRVLSRPTMDLSGWLAR
jgi:hypothetical protein